MDWLGFQYRIRHLHEAYFGERKVSESRAYSARNRDTGEPAKKIDDAILDLWHKGRCELLSEDEKDILAIRLNWAWKMALFEGMKPFEKIETLSEIDFVRILITQWRESGRETYKPWIVKSYESDGTPKQKARPSPNKQSPPEPTS
jgi:hypothetical protein